MKFADYPLADKIAEDNILLIDGTGGTKKISVSDLVLGALGVISPQNHRMIFRGKNLGSSVSSEHKLAIQNGTFEDLYLGDYWEIGSVKWRIADFDYWYGCGDSKFAKHHLVIVPDTALYNAKMNDSNTTTGGYSGSVMYKTNLATAKSTITGAFSDMVLSHREYLIGTVSNGYPNSGSWLDSTVDLMNESMVFGGLIYTPSGNGTTTVKRMTNSRVQLALFQVAPFFINNDDKGGRVKYWLRDIANVTSFVSVSDYGPAQDTSASTQMGVRPAFAIG